MDVEWLILTEDEAKNKHPGWRED
jgi:hypothetical protein